MHFENLREKTVSKARASQLFEENAVLFGRHDGVPESTVISLFGADAVKFAKRPEGAGTNFNVYGIGGYSANYLTERGFYLAARYYNVKNIEEAESAGEDR